MDKYYSFVARILTFLMCCFSITLYAAQPLWTFTPLTATSLTISSTGSAIVQYRVTNQSTKPHTLVLTPITGVTQLTAGAGVCDTRFTLPTQGSSCILSLQINGSSLSRSITEGPVVCQQGNSLQCYRPSQVNILNIRLTQSGVTIGGAIVGLTANGLILQNNGTDNLLVGANATSFTFPTPVTPGSNYNVTIAHQPAGLSCSVYNGSGLATTNVTNVVVSCILSGVLIPVVGSPFPSGQNPRNAIVSPNNRFLYVTNESDNNVSAFSISPITGILTLVPGSPFATGNAPNNLAITPDNQFLYVSNTVDNTLSGFTINAITGALTPIAGSPFATGNQPVGVTISSNNNFVYVANTIGNNISAYSIGPSGALTPIAGSPFAAGLFPNKLVIMANGLYAYVANPTGTITGFSVNAITGSLSPLAGSPFAATNPNFLVISPNNEYVYVGTTGNNWISVYQINAGTGALTEITGSPFITPDPRDAVISSNSQLIFVTNNNFDTVSTFRIIPETGAMTPIAGSPYPTGNAPIGLAISPNDSFLYIANNFSHDVTGYRVS